jgi:hypothetical protein
MADWRLAARHQHSVSRQVGRAPQARQLAGVIKSGESSHVPQVLVAELSWPKEQHEQQIDDYHPRDQYESIGYRHGVRLRLHLSV